MSNEFQIPEFGANPVQDMDILAKLSEVAKTVRNESSFFKKIEVEEVEAEANLYFATGHVQKEFHLERASSKTNASAKTLEWHWWAFFSRCFRNYLEDQAPNRYSTLKSARIRPSDDKDMQSRKTLASGMGSISLDQSLAEDGEGSRATAHDIFGNSKFSDLADEVHEMNVLAKMEVDDPIAFNRLLDAARSPGDISVDGRTLSYQERIEHGIRSFHKLVDHSMDGFEELEDEFIGMLKGWRSVRGRYNKAPE
jgi:hypothetical protein